jgi:hypothetical protein
MTDFRIQIHPHRCPQLVFADLRSACERVANDKTLVDRFSWNEGFDGHSYVDLTFATERAEELWNVLRQQFYDKAEFAKSMQAGSIATCEGRRGWDDYLLLHHFDPAVKCDDPRRVS